MGVAYFLLLSCLGVAIIGQAQDCSSPVPGPNMNLRDQYINQQSFPSGSVVSFSCDVGYRASGGSPSITCTSGTWSPVRLQCERKSCGPVGDVLNGQVQYIEGTEFGDKAVITCDAGHNLVGRGELICQDQGWSGRLPVCEVVKCDPPPQIVDGTYSPENEEHSYRDVVQYKCKDTYTLIGSKSRTCSEDGTFKPDPPRCALIQCEEPAVDNADWIRRPPYRPGATVTIQCRPGYVLDGNQILTCNNSGSWLPAFPTCNGITSIATTTTTTTTTTKKPTGITSIATTTTTTTTTTKKPTDDREEPEEDGKPGGGVVAGVVVSVLLGILALITAICVGKRIKNKKNRGFQRGSPGDANDEGDQIAEM